MSFDPISNQTSRTPSGPNTQTLDKGDANPTKSRSDDIKSQISVQASSLLQQIIMGVACTLLASALGAGIAIAVMTLLLEMPIVLGIAVIAGLGSAALAAGGFILWNVYSNKNGGKDPDPSPAIVIQEPEIPQNQEDPSKKHEIEESLQRGKSLNETPTDSEHASVSSSTHDSESGTSQSTGIMASNKKSESHLAVQIQENQENPNKETETEEIKVLDEIQHNQEDSDTEHAIPPKEEIQKAKETASESLRQKLQNEAIIQPQITKDLQNQFDELKLKSSIIFKISVDKSSKNAANEMHNALSELGKNLQAMVASVHSFSNENINKMVGDFIESAMNSLVSRQRNLMLKFDDTSESAFDLSSASEEFNALCEDVNSVSDILIWLKIQCTPNDNQNTQNALQNIITCRINEYKVRENLTIHTTSDETSPKEKIKTEISQNQKTPSKEHFRAESKDQSNEKSTLPNKTESLRKEDQKIPNDQTLDQDSHGDKSLPTGFGKNNAPLPTSSSLFEEQKLLEIKSGKVEWRNGKYVKLEKSESEFVGEAIPDSNEGGSKSEDEICFLDCQITEDGLNRNFAVYDPGAKYHFLLGGPLDSLDRELDERKQFFAMVGQQLELKGHESLANQLSIQISKLQNMKEVLVDSFANSSCDERMTIYPLYLGQFNRLCQNAHNLDCIIKKINQKISSEGNLDEKSLKALENEVATIASQSDEIEQKLNAKAMPPNERRRFRKILP